MKRSALLFAALLVALPLSAQTVPFGKNKIQYTDFDWQILSGEHIDVYYYPNEREIAGMALAYAEESYDYLEERLQHHPFRRIPLVVYSSDQHFEQTNLTPGFIPEGVLGFTEFLKRRVALPFRGSYAQFRHTLRHELVHFFQLSKLSETYALHGQIRTAQLPLWWSEGLAEYLSSAQDGMDEMVNHDLVLNGFLPDLKTFSYSRSFLAYPLGGELHHFLAERFGEERIVEMYDEIWKYDNFEDAFEGVYGVSLEDLDREWRYHLEKRYFPLRENRAPLSVAADPVVWEKGPNFKPTVEVLEGDTVPQLFFFSPRDGWSNIYHTDLRRGEEGVHVEVHGQRSAEFESFHTFESRMDVSSEGILVFASKFHERDALFLWDVSENEVVGRYQWNDLVGIKSPSLSPDGRRAVFAGLSTSGPADLYVVDFETGERTALTADRYDDQDPDWSPDGRRIVWSSDRTTFGSEGALNLFLYDLDEDRIRFLTYGPWSDQDPKWSREGDRIAFTSDRTGLFQLYTVDPAGNGQRISNFTGGAFDPEWLPDDSGVIFTGYHEGGFALYHQEVSPDPGAGHERIALSLPPELESVLPTDGLRVAASPGRSGTDENHGEGSNGNGSSPPTAEELDPTWGWSELRDDEVRDADPQEYSGWKSISLDFAGGDAIIAPGALSAQGLQLLGSDMLGNHIAFLSITSIQSDLFENFQDAFSGQLLYMNLSHRLNWGAALFRLNGLFRDVAFNRYREESYGGFFVASYPFSKFRRLELQIGVERSIRQDEPDAFGPDLRTDPRNLTRDAVVSRNFLSYVKDNTLWLPTGPIDGTRYNLTGGLVTDLSRARAESYILMADARRYLRTSLQTAVALRGFGYFSDGAIPSRAYLGGPHRLRGYPRLSLAGSRVWLVNSEWRFPLFNRLTFNLPVGNLTFPGVQGAFFADLGSSWIEDTEPEGSWGSYGMSFRMSLGFPFVLRLDWGKRWGIGDEPPVFFGSDEEFDDVFVDFFFGFNF